MREACSLAFKNEVKISIQDFVYRERPGMSKKVVYIGFSSLVYEGFVYA